MNKRIKMLAEDAGIGLRWDTTSQFEVFLEKFAELVVKECAKRSEELGNPELGQGLLKHFGIEE
jgi:hypothetical protein